MFELKPYDLEDIPLKLTLAGARFCPEADAHTWGDFGIIIEAESAEEWTIKEIWMGTNLLPEGPLLEWAASHFHVLYGDELDAHVRENIPDAGHNNNDAYQDAYGWAS